MTDADMGRWQYRYDVQGNFKLKKGDFMKDVVFYCENLVDLT